MGIKGNFSLIILGVLLLLLLLSISANVRFIYFSRASGASGQSFSVENSYTSLSPVSALADGVERVRLSVFLLNDEGRGVPLKTVTLTKQAELIVEDIQPQTDTYGKAVFDLHTSAPGDYLIEALVDGIKVGESVKARFN